jgi:uncharacterized protein YbjT (DUF2867 family)
MQPKRRAKFIAYTSLLHADKSPLGLHVEHVETEKMLADSGIPYALLRNGWYTENYLASAPAALAHGVFIGAAETAKSPRPPAQIMPLPPHALSAQRAMPESLRTGR